MEKTIFVNSDNLIDTYSININDKMIKNIQSQIDTYSGKGNLLEDVGGVDFFNHFQFHDKKVEVVSKTYLRTVQTCDYCCGEISDMDVYNYRYYAYKPHKLSTLCDELLNNRDSIDKSYVIRQLLEYEPETQLEHTFLNQIIRQIKFEKIDSKYISQSDLTLLPKENLSTRIKGDLDINGCQHCIVSGESNFEDVLNQRISDMETIMGAFYERELCGQPFKYTDEEKRNMKKKTLSSLPSDLLLKRRTTGI